MFVTYSTAEEAEKAIAGQEKPENANRKFIRESKSAWMAFDAEHQFKPGQKRGRFGEGGPRHKKARGSGGPFTRGRNRGYQGKNPRGNEDE